MNIIFNREKKIERQKCEIKEQNALLAKRVLEEAVGHQGLDSDDLSFFILIK